MDQARDRDARDERPRERLLAHGAALLTDAELVALLLGTGTRGRSAAVLARELLDPRGLAALAEAAPRELAAVSGIGVAKATQLLAACELGRRIAARPLRRGDRIASPEDVHRHFHARLRDAATEQFHTVLLDSRHRVIRSVLTSQGTLTASLVHPREVFRPALREAAAALVLVHNHPSGDPSPSPEDREITRRLAQAGTLLGIPVLDHVIVADRGFASLREQGDLPAPRDPDASP
jgi:DNA repair protein RadC